MKDKKEKKRHVGIEMAHKLLAVDTLLSEKQTVDLKRMLRIQLTSHMVFVSAASLCFALVLLLNFTQFGEKNFILSLTLGIVLAVVFFANIIVMLINYVLLKKFLNQVLNDIQSSSNQTSNEQSADIQLCEDGAYDSVDKKQLK